MQGNRSTHKGYGVTAIGTKGVVTGGEKHSYRPLAEDMVKFFQTGIAPVPPETTLEVHAFMEAADESQRRGGRRRAHHALMRGGRVGPQRGAVQCVLRQRLGDKPLRLGQVICSSVAP